MNNSQILRTYFGNLAKNQGDYLAKGSLPNWAQNKSRQIVIRRIKESGVKSVLDLGCGPGDLLAMLVKTSRKIRLAGVDISGEMLKLARAKVRLGKFWQANIVKLPFNNKYEAVICLNTLHHLSSGELIKVLGEMRKTATKKIVIEVKNPNSVFALVMWADLTWCKKIPVYLHQPKKVIKDMDKNKWRLVKTQQIIRWPIISPYCLYDFEKE